MSTLQIILLGAVVALLLLALLAFVAWRMIGRRGRVLAKRVSALPVRQQAQLAGSLFGDPRLPAHSRIVLALLVAYLALPVDIIPDFIPVIGQIDDVVMLSLGTALILRSLPQGVFEEHLSRLESEARTTAVEHP